MTASKSLAKADRPAASSAPPDRPGVLDRVAYRECVDLTEYLECLVEPGHLDQEVTVALEGLQERLANRGYPEDLLFVLLVDEKGRRDRQVLLVVQEQMDYEESQGNRAEWESLDPQGNLESLVEMVNLESPAYLDCPVWMVFVLVLKGSYFLMYH